MLKQILIDQFRMKESGEQFDDRIVEVAWDTDRGTWRMMRIRDDKPNANHKSIMQKILVSIEDGVEIEAVCRRIYTGKNKLMTCFKQLLARSESIKSAWKARAARSGPRPAQQQQQPPPQVRSTQQAAQPPARSTSASYPTTPGGLAQPGVMAGLRR